MISTIEISIKDAMSQNHISYGGQIIADGSIHRFHINGDKTQSLNGWYVIYPDGIPCGAFGSWKSGKTHYWSAKSIGTLPIEDQHLLYKKIAAIKQRRLNERTRNHALA